MENYQLKPVGIVENKFNEPADHREIKKNQSTIIIDDKYTEALLNIGDCEYLDVVFYFHKSQNYRMTLKIHTGAERGVFASRSPDRPNSIGITTVKLIKCIRNKLIVEGLDAINNTPVIDIKPCDNSIFSDNEINSEINKGRLKADPGCDIIKYVLSGNLEQLLINAGQIHRHICPGLAMGVIAASGAVKEMKTFSDGMEDIVAITETNNCFSDGVQYVTGCTFGNNALIFKDLGKTAFTLASRHGKGIRICSLPQSRDTILKINPDFDKYYSKVVVKQNHDKNLKSLYKKAALSCAFDTLNIPFNKLFTITETMVKIPDYAPIHDSVICSSCKESVMKSRIKKINNNDLCLSCLDAPYNLLDGSGINVYL